MKSSETRKLIYFRIYKDVIIVIKYVVEIQIQAKFLYEAEKTLQAKRLPYKEAMISHGHRGSFSQGSWIGEMQQASDKSVIISEILDPRTKNLLSMSKISDYVLSNELVSMALAMVAEDRQINDVLEELFAEEV